MFTVVCSLIKKKVVHYLTALFVIFSYPANAAIIEQDTSLIGGNTYQLDFTIVNDSLASGIFHWFVTLDQTLFENLIVLAGPADWDTFAINSGSDNHTFGAQPPGFFPAPPGFPFISLGNEQGDFSLQVDFLGAGTVPLLPGGVANEDLSVEVGDFTLNSPLVAVAANPIPPDPGTPPNAISEPPVFLLQCLAIIFLFGRGLYRVRVTCRDAYQN
ncbi:hypothetical protein [Thalassotalea montiporae]